MTNKHLVLKPFNSNIFYKNRIFVINNENNIFYGLRTKFRLKGWLIDTIDLPLNKKVDLFIYCDVPYPWEVGLWLSIIRYKDKCILLNFESPIVNPFSQIKFIMKMFRRVYTWNSHLLDGVKIKKFYIPQFDFRNTKRLNSVANKKLLTAVFSYKRSVGLLKMISGYKKDLYTDRLKLLKSLNKYRGDVDLFGRGWEKNDTTAGIYKGEIEKKIEVLQKYKYCLAIENVSSPGYITEKLFDCFKASCVPVYLGAPDINEYVPEDCFIDLRKFKSAGDLVFYLKSIDDGKYQDYLSSIDNFMKNPKNTQRWSESGLIKIIAEELNQQ